MNKLREICIFILFCFACYCIVYFFAHVSNFSIKYTDQGKIVAKSSDEVAIKRGTRTELYLCIEFEKDGFKALNVDPTTYFRHKIGDTVAFDLSRQNTEINVIFFFAGAILCFVICFMFAVIFILWILGVFNK